MSHKKHSTYKDTVKGSMWVKDYSCVMSADEVFIMAHSSQSTWKFIRPVVLVIIAKFVLKLFKKIIFAYLIAPKPFPCPLLDKKCSEKIQLIKHLLKKHQIQECEIQDYVKMKNLWTRLCRISCRTWGNMAKTEQKPAEYPSVVDDKKEETDSSKSKSQ